jgi:ribosome biogenesis GTPase / thiamine phosphate phosphatase
MRSVPDLATLGWDDAWRASFERQQEPGLVPGRVAVQHRGAYDVLTEGGEVRARVASRLRRRADARGELPVVGDWVALEPETRAIESVLPRRTTFSRRAAHDAASEGASEQVVCANVDVVFVVSPLGEEVSVPLLERYLTLAWQSGAAPAILLSKADLEPDPDTVVESLAGIGGEVPVVAVSVRTGFGLDTVRSLLDAGRTGALVGPSGAGKSTLVNVLVGEELIATGELRERGGGRHTTTRRQLVLLPGGGLLVDNPGMREVHLWIGDEGLEDAFPDIAELESDCRFVDCRHETEPGCAVRAALAEGSLSEERWQRYRALRDELARLEEQLRRAAQGRRGSRGKGGVSENA